MKKPTLACTVTMATVITATIAEADRAVRNPAANISPATISVDAAVKACPRGHRIPIEPNHDAVPARPFFTLFAPCTARKTPNTTRTIAVAASILSMSASVGWAGADDTIGG